MTLMAQPLTEGEKLLELSSELCALVPASHFLFQTEKHLVAKTSKVS